MFRTTDISNENLESWWLRIYQIRLIVYRDSLYNMLPLVLLSRHDKTCLRGSCQRQTKTSLLSYMYRG